MATAKEEVHSMCCSCLINASKTLIIHGWQLLTLGFECFVVLCVCMSVYVATKGCNNTAIRHMTAETWEKHTHTSKCMLLTQMLTLRSPGRFGNHSDLCSHGSSSFYPPVFVKVL